MTREQLDVIIRKNDVNAKQHQKTYADEKRRVKVSDIEIGDSVLVKNEEKGKLITPYNVLPYRVIAKKGSQVTVERERHRMTRNTSHLKKVHIQMGNSEVSDSDEEPDMEPGEDAEQMDTPQRPQRNRRPPNYLQEYIT